MKLKMPKCNARKYYGYSLKVYDLALAFLEDDLSAPLRAKHADKLAREIQQVIEDYLERGKDRLEW